MDPFIAEIIMFGGNFAPRGWAYCDGQLLPISQNTALFSLLGTTYGGDGRTTFALPDMRGRVAIGPRHGAGLSNYQLGQKGGAEQIILMQSQMPSHNHTAIIQVSEEDANSDEANGSYLTNTTGAFYYQGSNIGANSSISGVAVGNEGGNLPHENRQPYLAINYIIALQGIFPSRN